MPINKETILIVGAGPVGLTSALRLSQLGIRSIVIEKNKTIQSELRASTFHPPTIEMLDELGIAEVPHGIFNRHRRLWDVAEFIPSVHERLSQV